MNRIHRNAYGLLATGAMVAGSLVIAPLAQASPKVQTALRGTRHGLALTALAKSKAKSFHLAPYSIRLEDQLLAALRYLPLTFKPTPVKVSTTHPTTTTTSTTTTAPTPTSTLVPPTSTTTTTTVPPTTTTTLPSGYRVPSLRTNQMLKGSFVWRFKIVETNARSQWKVGTDNQVLKGAVMAFQTAVGLPFTGNMDTTTWLALQHAAYNGATDTKSYNYVLVSQSQPETLRLFVNGRQIYTTLVNTGISSATTANGTYPVYVRYLVTTMSGTNPNGTKYHDPGIPWVSYFNGGDALHGFIRSSYGYPQSLGCVEMPFANAGRVFPYTPIGTLVTVTA